MPVYRYQGRNPRGELVDGSIEGGSADAVAGQLFSGGITPIDIREARAPEAATPGGLRLRGGKHKVQLSDLILFSHQMYTLTKAGVPMIQALAGLVQSTRNPTLARVFADISEQLESGRELSVALSRHAHIFPSLIISLVQVGENTGRLDEVFAQISRYLEQEKDTRDRIKSATRYPMFVMGAIGIALVIINVFVIPVFAKLFKSFRVELPWATRVLIGTSDFFVAYWPYMLVGLVLLVLGLRNYVKTDVGRYTWDRLRLRLPLIGSIITRATLARYARSFSMAVRSGVPLVQALGVVARAVDNAYIAERILAMRTGIERGESLTRTAVASGLFTPLVLQMLAVGEETGQVDTLLTEVAEFYEREVDYDLKNLATAIEPILIVAIGIMVLILALGVFLPMWDLAKAARGGG
ncbi:MAG: type II secretion system F family protein [Gammaproteobacteria bacterium]|nr:type II secretion system F family protein [Gammaproteobacteria bacterium]